MTKNYFLRKGYVHYNISGSLFILFAAATFPAMGALVKLISYELHPFVIAFFRSLFGLILILPLMLKEKSNIIKTNKLSFHLSNLHTLELEQYHDYRVLLGLINIIFVK